MNKNQYQNIPNILVRLAHLLGTEVKNGKLDIPESLGAGYCIGFEFNPHIRMLISNYRINKEIDIENPEFGISKRIIFFKFQNIFPKSELSPLINKMEETPSVLIATSRINTDHIISIHNNTATINIEVDADYLNGLFNLSEKSPILQSLLQNTQPLLFEQIIYPSLRKVVDEIISETVDETFKLFFLKIKAEELVCRLLMELVKRDEANIYSLNSRDIQTLYKVKERILETLNLPPVIKELAVFANMSPTKLKRLFKQIFGNSIFNYYQAFRMKEAARLLKNENLSVSEVGYSLGFTNLSHFARIFNEHIGMKPKQYTKS